jgi:hypothetical protein
MRSEPLSSAASRRRAEEQFKTKKKVDFRRHSRTATRGGENRAPARASAGQGSSRQGDCKSRRGGSDSRSICAAPTRFGGTSGFKSVRTQVRVLWRPAPECSVRLPARLLLLDAVADRRG